MNGLVKLLFAGTIVAGTAGCAHREPARPYNPAEEYYDSVYGEGVGKMILYGDFNLPEDMKERRVDENK